jgi:hypothetical protein
MKYKITEQLLKWLMHWLGLIDSILGIATLGFVFTSFKLWGASQLARWRFRNERI